MSDSKSKFNCHKCAYYDTSYCDASCEYHKNYKKDTHILDKELPFNYDRMDMEINTMPDDKIDIFLRIFITLLFFSPFIVYPVIRMIEYFIES